MVSNFEPDNLWLFDLVVKKIESLLIPLLTKNKNTDFIEFLISNINKIIKIV